MCATMQRQMRLARIERCDEILQTEESLYVIASLVWCKRSIMFKRDCSEFGLQIVTQLITQLNRVWSDRAKA